jgi:hypothetical protein
MKFIYSGLISLDELIQVGTVRRAVEKGKNNSAMAGHQDLMGTSRTNHYSSQDNDDYIDSESDRQLLLMR